VRSGRQPSQLLPARLMILSWPTSTVSPTNRRAAHEPISHWRNDCRNSRCRTCRAHPVDAVTRRFKAPDRSTEDLRQGPLTAACGCSTLASNFQLVDMDYHIAEPSVVGRDSFAQSAGVAIRRSRSIIRHLATTTSYPNRSGGSTATDPAALGTAACQMRVTCQTGASRHRPGSLPRDRRSADDQR
jgi:hypothetical protein